MALKKLCCAAILRGWLMLCLGGCDGGSDRDLKSMTHPDLSEVSEPLLLDAIQGARQTIVAAPDSAAAWVYLGHLYWIHGWEAEAIPYYQRATEIAGEEFRWLYFLGRGLHEKEPARAVAALTRALAIKPYPQAYIYWAYALRNLGRFEAARQQFERAAELDPRSYFAQLGMGQLALAARQFQQARRILQQALVLGPRREEAHAALAQVAMALGEEQLAGWHAQEARKFTTTKEIPDPLWREAENAGATPYWLSKRGGQYLSEGNFEAALAEFSKLVSSGMEHPKHWCDYGTTLLRLERTQEAITALEKALELARLPSNRPHVGGRTGSRLMVRIYGTLGQAKMQAGALDQAEQLVRQALKLDPGMLQVVYNLALVCYRQGRPEEAILLLQNTQGAAANPQTSRLLNELLRRRNRR